MAEVAYDGIRQAAKSLERSRLELIIARHPGSNLDSPLPLLTRKL
jgi:hypothetical protein